MYVYVASSWRNPVQPAIVEALRAEGIGCYDFRNPGEAHGFSWAEVRPGPPQEAECAHCGEPIIYTQFGTLAWEPDWDPDDDPVIWRHVNGGYAACRPPKDRFAVPRKGSDFENVDTYLRMIDHPRAVEGFRSDFDAMQRADTFVMVLPCGKSAHLELGWAVGAGKRTAILLENPVEPELMYKMVDFIAPSITDLMAWLEAAREAA